MQSYDSSPPLSNNFLIKQKNEMNIHNFSSDEKWEGFFTYMHKEILVSQQCMYTIEPQPLALTYVPKRPPCPFACTKTTPLLLCMYQNDTPAKSCTKTNPFCRNVPKRRVPT